MSLSWAAGWQGQIDDFGAFRPGLPFAFYQRAELSLQFTQLIHVNAVFRAENSDDQR